MLCPWLTRLMKIRGIRMKTLLLNNAEVGQLIDLDEIYEAVKEGYASYNNGLVIQPGIQHLNKPDSHATFDFKTCLDMGSGFFSMKSSSGGFDDNVKIGQLPGFNLVYLFDAETSACSCIMEANYIRNLRTAAGAAIANNYLARKDASVYFAYGTGRIGKASLRATMRIRDIKEVYCFGWLEGDNEAFIAEMSKEYPNVKFYGCETPEEGARKADIIVSVTLARKGPIIKKEWLKPGTHITEIGTDAVGKQELDPNCFDGTKIVNDSIEAAIQFGDTHNAIEAGVITKDDIYGEIGEIITGQKAGRENDEEITVYDTVGMGIQDLAMGVCIYKKALKAGLGTEFEFI